jgi:hypothetical protein
MKHYLLFFIIGFVSFLFGFFLDNLITPFPAMGELLLSILILSFILSSILYSTKNARIAVINFSIFTSIFIFTYLHASVSLPEIAWMIILFFSPAFPVLPLTLFVLSLLFKKNYNLSYALKASALSYAGLVVALYGIQLFFPPEVGFLNLYLK